MYDAIYSILNVFVKYFPKHESTEKTHKFLDRTRKWVKLKAIEEGKSFYSDDFSDKLVDIAKDVGYDMPYDYIGCMGSRGEAFNYTSSYYCGMWTLWHLLTVQRYKIMMQLLLMGGLECLWLWAGGSYLIENFWRGWELRNHTTTCSTDLDSVC